MIHNIFSLDQPSSFLCLIYRRHKNALTVVEAKLFKHIQQHSSVLRYMYTSNCTTDWCIWCSLGSLMSHLCLIPVILCIIFVHNNAETQCLAIQYICTVGYTCTCTLQCIAPTELQSGYIFPIPHTMYISESFLFTHLLSSIHATTWTMWVAP